MESALAAGLRLLSQREMFVAELRAELERRGHDRAEIEAAVDWLGAKGILRNERAGELLLHRRSGRNARGELALRHELESKGVEEELIAALLATREGSDRDRARELLNAFPKPDRARAGRFLGSRGFDEDTIEAVLDERFPREDW